MNCTIFAYGQTASGKTYTIRGDENSQGLIPLTVNAVFEKVNDEIMKQKFTIKIAFMELYNEQINDLLNAENTNLELKENFSGVYIKGITLKEVNTKYEALNCLLEGDQIKKIGETMLNTQSSRSHTIFRIIIESSPLDLNSGELARISQLNIVDLAGSEGASRTKAEGLRLKYFWIKLIVN